MEAPGVRGPGFTLEMWLLAVTTGPKAEPNLSAKGMGFKVPKPRRSHESGLCWHHSISAPPPGGPPGFSQHPYSYLLLISRGLRDPGALLFCSAFDLR